MSEGITPRSDDDSEPPSLNIIRSYLSKEFGERLESREAAELGLGQKCFLAPLGTVTTTKRSGKRKHRIIQDLKWNRVNDTEERAVLPRGIDHVADLAILAETHTLVEATVLDFVDAFMAVPTEQPFNCAEVHRFEGRDDCVLWRVLGF